MPSTVERTVLTDNVRYTVPQAENPKKRQRMHATKGMTISVEPSEAARLEALGAVGSESDLLGAIGVQAAPKAPTSSADLRLMTVEGLAAFMATASETDQDNVSTWMEELLREKAQDNENTRETLARAAGLQTSDTPDGDPETTEPETEKSGSDEPSKGQPGATASDEELGNMNAGELTAYLSQHPGDIDRVEAVNDARGEKSYSSVTSAIAKTREELDKQ